MSVVKPYIISLFSPSEPALDDALVFLCGEKYGRTINHSTDGTVMLWVNRMTEADTHR